MVNIHTFAANSPHLIGVLLCNTLIVSRMERIYLVGAAMAAFLLAYLVYVLVKPEKF